MFVSRATKNPSLIYNRKYFHEKFQFEVLWYINFITCESWNVIDNSILPLYFHPFRKARAQWRLYLCCNIYWTGTTDYLHTFARAAQNICWLNIFILIGILIYTDISFMDNCFAGGLPHSPPVKRERQMHTSRIESSTSSWDSSIDIREVWRKFKGRKRPPQ